ncbi:hypothetical protein JN535_19020 [Cellulosimicrobium cellulans]|uniref:hypothetical protein n=1 Tax=Cellulosimicrobium cellulans TaxID=1710 RepID=UPI00196483B2|nr:hypothetical protein [Cellulosimicrobium cellulans]MBN0042248.1 hypothetical protein [Cellulosimicrobium cellulans]HLT83489.1 hypothetical protein [Phototrophicaceae bacterium]
MSEFKEPPADRPAAPADPGPGPAGLYDAARLAARLGIATSSLRNSRLRGVPWLPEPVGILNGGPVWRAADLEGIEDRRRPPGRPPADRPAAARAAD